MEEGEWQSRQLTVTLHAADKQGNVRGAANGEPFVKSAREVWKQWSCKWEERRDTSVALRDTRDVIREAQGLRDN